MKQKLILRKNHNGGHNQGNKKFQNKTGGSILENLKRVIQIFGKNMKKSFGMITMQEFAQMVKMENGIKQESPKPSQIYL